MGTLHTSVAPHKSCGCKACIKGLKKMKPIKKIPAIKKWKGKQAFNKKELIMMVPRGGIEPPTRGFSVLCSTD